SCRRPTEPSCHEATERAAGQLQRLVRCHLSSVRLPAPLIFVTSFHAGPALGVLHHRWQITLAQGDPVDLRVYRTEGVPSKKLSEHHPCLSVFAEPFKQTSKIVVIH